MSPVTLYDYPASANCLKARMLLALLGQPYERVETDIFAGATLTDAFGALNPARETPVLVTADGEVARPVERDHLVPRARGRRTCRTGRSRRAHVVQWLFFEQERVMPGIGGPRFRLQTGRAAVDDDAIVARLAVGRDALAQLDAAARGAALARRRRRRRSPTWPCTATRTWRRRRGIALAPYPAFRAWIGAPRRAARVRERPRAVPGQRRARAPAARSTIRAA